MTDDILVSAWIVLGLVVYGLGHYAGFLHARQHTPGITARRFLWQQLYFSAHHPVHTIWLFGATMIIPPLMLPMLIVIGSSFDMQTASVEIFSRPISDRCPRNSEGLLWSDAVARSLHQEQAVIKERIVADCNESAKATEMFGRLLSGTAIFLGLLVTPFAATAARAQTKNKKDDQRQEQPITMKEDVATGGDPPENYLPEIHGGVMGQLDLVVDQDGVRDPTAYLRIVNLAVLGQGPANTSYLVVANLASLPMGDPINIASVSWEPFDDTRLTAGRVISPVGKMRNPPPYKLTSLTYTNQPFSSALFDQGALVRQSLFGHLTLEAGVLSGVGKQLETPFAPEAVGRAEFSIWKLTLGVSGVIGTRSEGHQHTIAAYVEMTPADWFFQTEVVGSTQADQPLVFTASGAMLFAWRPNDHVEPYMRADVLFSNANAQAPPAASVDTGVNLKLGLLALRLALFKALTPTEPVQLHTAVQATF